MQRKVNFYEKNLFLPLKIQGDGKIEVKQFHDYKHEIIDSWMPIEFPLFVMQKGSSCGLTAYESAVNFYYSSHPEYNGYEIAASKYHARGYSLRQWAKDLDFTLSGEICSTEPYEHFSQVLKIPGKTVKADTATSEEFIKSLCKILKEGNTIIVSSEIKGDFLWTGSGPERNLHWVLLIGYFTTKEECFFIVGQNLGTDFSTPYYIWPAKKLYITNDHLPNHNPFAPSECYLSYSQEKKLTFYRKEDAPLKSRLISDKMIAQFPFSLYAIPHRHPGGSISLKKKLSLDGSFFNNILLELQKDNVKFVKQALEGLDKKDMKVLLNSYFDTNTFLQLSVRFSSFKCTRLLIELGASVHFSELQEVLGLAYQFVKDDKKDQLQELFSIFKNKLRYIINLSVNDEYLLHEASKKNNFYTTKILLEFGACPNTKDPYGNPPLFWAAFNAGLPIIDLLLEHQAKSNIVNNEKFDFAKHLDFGCQHLINMKQYKESLDFFIKYFITYKVPLSNALLEKLSLAFQAQLKSKESKDDTLFIFINKIFENYFGKIQLDQLPFMEESETITSWKDIAIIYKNIGNCLYKGNFADKAIIFYEHSIKLHKMHFKYVNRSDDLITSYSNLIIALSSTKNYNKIIQVAQEARKYFYAADKNNNISFIINKIQYHYIQAKLNQMKQEKKQEDINMKNFKKLSDEVGSLPHKYQVILFKKYPEIKNKYLVSEKSSQLLRK